MKIEVGDVVDTIYSRNVEVLEIDELGRVYFKDRDGNDQTTLLSKCTLVKKGEKKMEMYKGIEAYEALREGKTLEFAQKKNFIFSIGTDGLIRESKKGTRNWKYSDISVNFFMGKTFIEYKEPLKYKVGDEVWVKAMVIEVDERQGEMPYLLDLGDECREWFNEDEIKGGNE